MQTSSLIYFQRRKEDLPKARLERHKWLGENFLDNRIQFFHILQIKHVLDEALEHLLFG